MPEKEPKENNSYNKPKPEASNSNYNNTSTNEAGKGDLRKGLNDDFNKKDTKK
jgi:hypothetical protein